MIILALIGGQGFFRQCGNENGQQAGRGIRKGFSDIQQVKAARGIVLWDENCLTEV